MTSEVNIVGELVDWSEDIKFNTRAMTIKGDQYNKWIDELLPAWAKELPVLSGPPTPQMADGTVAVSGGYLYYLRELPTETTSFTGFLGMCRPRKSRASLLTFQGRKESRVFFDRPVKIPVLARVGGSSGTLRIMMSLTPMEVISQRYGIRRSKGNTVIGGLGMGWFARRVLERKSVKHVTVVEKDEGVLKTFGNPLKDEFGSKLTLVNADVYDFLESLQDDPDRVLMDIWDNPDGWFLDRKFRDLEKRYTGSPTLWRWGRG